MHKTQICEDQPYKHLIRSDICCITEQYKDALAEINKAIELNPGELIFYHQRGTKILFFYCNK